MKRFLLAASAALLLAGCGDDMASEPANDTPSKPRPSWKCTSDGPITACKFTNPGYDGFPLSRSIPPCRPISHFVNNTYDGDTLSITAYCIKEGV